MAKALLSFASIAAFKGVAIEELYWVLRPKREFEMPAGSWRLINSKLKGKKYALIPGK